MRKVIYAVTKDGKEKVKVSGIGFITDTDLITAQTSKKGNPYIRVYEDCLQYCHEIAGKDGEFKGWFSEIYEIDDREIEVNYYIYYKMI